eukprot:5736266-Amphidinium_carterae.2
MADWNITPMQLEETRFPRLVGGAIVCTHEQTCAAGEGRELDYAVVADCMRDKVVAVHLMPAHASVIRPHTPVLLTLRGHSPQDHIQVQTKWRKLPANQPMGPFREAPPIQWSWREGGRPATFLNGWLEWSRAAECYIRSCMDEVPNRTKYPSRTFQHKRIPHAQHYASVEAPGVSRSERAWAVLRSVICRQHRDVPRLEGPRHTQLQQQLQPFSLMGKEWTLAEFLEEFASASDPQRQELIEEVTDRQTQERAATTRQRTAQWRTWAAAAVTKGAGQAHRWTKRTMPQADFEENGEPSMYGGGVLGCRGAFLDNNLGTPANESHHTMPQPVATVGCAAITRCPASISTSESHRLRWLESAHLELATHSNASTLD